MPFIGGAQLVAHVGHEGALGAACSFGRDFQLGLGFELANDGLGLLTHLAMQRQNPEQRRERHRQ
jgi:hypothetical protein